MKNKLVAILVVALGFWSSSSLATLITDTYNPGAGVYLSVGNGSYDFSHDLTSYGFNPANSTIVSATLLIDVRDDWDADYNRYGYRPGYCHGSWGSYHCHSGYSYLISSAQFENLNVNVDETNLGTYEIDYSPLGFNLDLSSLQTDGILNVSLLPTLGDMLFYQSTLTVDFVTDVPEPGSLALLALGLAGLCVCRRKASGS